MRHTGAKYHGHGTVPSLPFPELGWYRLLLFVVCWVFLLLLNSTEQKLLPL